MMPRALPVAALLALALAADEAKAGDALVGTRGGELRELEHRIELRFAPGYATAVVRRTVRNAATTADEAVYDLLLPDRAVATRVRLRARDGAPWRVGEPLAAREAAGRYRRATSFDPQRPLAGDAALLSWSGPGALSLRLFPVASARTVEYTLELPATWIEGRWVIALDDLGVADAPVELRVHAANPNDRLFLDGEVVRSGHRARLHGAHEVALAPRDRPAVALELASLATGSEQTFVHWRLTLARSLAAIPRGVHVVVALDASRSLAAGVDEAQRRAALAYLEHLRAPALAARVAVLTFDRRVRRWSDGWVSVERAIELLSTATLTRANGSDVALALHEARELFAHAPAGAPRRVVLLTDFMTASSRSLAAHEAAAADTGAIVHLAAVADDAPTLTRDDRHAWASVAARTGGVVWQAAIQDDADLAARAAAIALFEEWARPVRIDALRVDLGRPYTGAPLPASLAEGEGIEAQSLLDRPVEQVVVRGLTWNLPFTRTAPRSASLSRRWAALMFATDAIEGLAAEDGLRLARRAGAVTPWTSHLVLGTGSGPSRDGFVRDPLPVAPLGKGGGGGTGRGRGRPRGAGFRGRLDRQTWLESQVVARWLGCGGAGHGVELELETTYDEVVEFTLRAPPSDARAACMREATWALELPTADFVDPRARWTIAVPPLRAR